MITLYFSLEVKEYRRIPNCCSCPSAPNTKPGKKWTEKKPRNRSEPPL